LSVYAETLRSISYIGLQANGVKWKNVNMMDLKLKDFKALPITVVAQSKA
jgi:hypothetical protein